MLLNLNNIKGNQDYNERAFAENEVYRMSIKRERQFGLWLAANLPNHLIEYSTRSQNTEQDIDYVVDTLRTISFKYCKACKRTGNIAFELEAYSHIKRDWVKGWYQTGRAEFYVFQVGTVYYLIDSQDLHTYIQQNSWQCIKSLGAERRRANKAIRHDHRDSKTGLFKLQDLLALGLAKKLGDITDRTRQRHIEDLLFIAKYRGKFYDPGSVA